MSENVDPVDRLFLPPTHGRVTPLQQSEKDKQRKSAKDPEEKFEEELEKKKRHGKVDHVEISAGLAVQPNADDAGDGKDADQQAEDAPLPPPSHVDVKA